MVVAEALARGLPVVAAEALGQGAERLRPGLLVPPADAMALGDALRAWLDDPGLRRRLRAAARERRELRPGQSNTTSVVAGILAGASR
jgi:glycosyltransferase involved in cell wall biosynthesis